MAPQKDAAQKAAAQREKDEVEAATRKAMSGRGKKGVDVKSYLLVGSGTFICILAAVVAIWDSEAMGGKGATGGKRSPLRNLVNDPDSIIDITTRSDGNFTASASPFFNKWTLGDVKWGHAGISTTNMLGVAIQVCEADAKDEDGVRNDAVLPPQYDSRDAWPSCYNEVLDSGNCSGSYAFAAVDALSAKFCIADNDKFNGVRLSAQQILSCDKKSRSCKGGGVDTVWSYIQRRGLYTEECVPYEGKKGECKSSCDESKKLKVMSHCVLTQERAIKREIYNNGPVVAPINVPSEYLVYSSGVYSPTEGVTSSVKGGDPLVNGQDGSPLLHAVAVVGWGKSGGSKYWTVRHSWGSGWGENGYARVAMGSLLQENYMITGVVGTDKELKIAEEKAAAAEKRKAAREEERAAREAQKAEPQAEGEQKEKAQPGVIEGKYEKQPLDENTKELIIEYDDSLASIFVQSPLDVKLEEWAAKENVSQETFGDMVMTTQAGETIEGGPSNKEEFPITYTFKSKANTTEEEKKTLTVEWQDGFEKIFEKSPLEERVMAFAEKEELPESWQPTTMLNKNNEVIQGNLPESKEDFPITIYFSNMLGNYEWTVKGIEKLKSEKGMFEAFGSPEAGKKLTQIEQDAMEADGILKPSVKGGHLKEVKEEEPADDPEDGQAVGPDGKPIPEGPEGQTSEPVDPPEGASEESKARDAEAKAADKKADEEEAARKEAMEAKIRKEEMEAKQAKKASYTKMKVSELKKAAKSGGAKEADLEAADDADSPKEALIDILMKL